MNKKLFKIFALLTLAHNIDATCCGVVVKGPKLAPAVRAVKIDRPVHFSENKLYDDASYLSSSNLPSPFGAKQFEGVKSLILREVNSTYSSGYIEKSLEIVLVNDKKAIMTFFLSNALDVPFKTYTSRFREPMIRAYNVTLKNNTIKINPILHVTFNHLDDMKVESLDQFIENQDLLTAVSFHLVPRSKKGDKDDVKFITDKCEILLCASNRYALNADSRGFVFPISSIILSSDAMCKAANNDQYVETSLRKTREIRKEISKLNAHDPTLENGSYIEDVLELSAKEISDSLRSIDA